MPADPTPVLQYINGFRFSKVMFAAVELGVFDRLETQSQTADSLSSNLGLHPSATQRLLDALVGMELLARDGSQYSNTALASELLTSSSPNRMTGYIKFSNDVSWKLWSHFENAIREGSHRWKDAYGWDQPIFSSFFADEAAMREFLMGMHGYGVISSPKVVRAVDLSPFQHLVDLGGATGHLPIAACEAYPELRATVFDLPDVVPVTKEIVGQSLVADRIDVVAGDFFADELPEADLMSLGRILHDWSDEKIDRLLSKIHQRLPEGGGLLLAEILIQDDRRGPDWGQMQDLNMLVCTEGRERTLEEYTALLKRAGFQHVTGQVTGAPVDAVLATK
ncbi:class I SAM-dependent methyltransferase [Rhodopirellula halodulae]|uniref:class I SAM-dependent methyltransferase n=1 Tax=Rhodopirellula halodulae TaxID=2894198 RepID=UPI001E3EE74B|nr:class I SAM-dependent methyltransferase [Rhodopirellula sp. JC737]MCC9656593.1 acetylserotonin O-methyltransferase [Rhodopirellula sp. JC737]